MYSVLLRGSAGKQEIFSHNISFSIFSQSFVCYCVIKSSFLLIMSHFREESDEFVEIGALNGLFVLGRSIGFIG